MPFPKIHPLEVPSKDIEVGGRFFYRGDWYLVVERKPHRYPKQCCVGCAFKIDKCPANYACSAPDRADGLFVWFVREK